MADQLERRFEGVDRATMPDLWGAIEVRAQRPAPEPRGPRVAALVLAVLVTAAVIGGLLWALSNRESQPAVQPGVNGDIGYVGGHGGSTHLFAVDPRTGATQQLTRGPGTDGLGAAWSPDGTQVVFERVASAGGTASMTTELVLRERDGTERVLERCAPPDPVACDRVPREGSVAWSPDGTRLAWVSAGPDDQIHVMDLRSGDVTSLCGAARCGSGLSQITWSPDGTRIAFSNAEAALGLSPSPSKTSRIWVQAADGSSQAVNITGPESGCVVPAGGCLDIGPSWSPNGKVIAFVRADAQAHTAEADTIRPDGSNLDAVATCPGHDGCTGVPAPAWSPDGSRFALAIAHDPTTHQPAIRVFMPSNGGYTDLSICGGCSASTIAWSPDGHSLAFFAGTTSGRAGIYVMSADGSGLRQVVGQDAAGLGSWLPEGALPAPVNATGSPRAKVDTPTAPAGSNGDVGLVGSAPDAGGATDVFAVDPTTGAVTNLTNTPDAAEYDPVWSADGSTVVFERDLLTSSGSKPELVIRRADGSEQEIPCQGASCTVPAQGNYALSPDGTKLALVAPVNVSSLEVIDLATGGVTTLCTQAQCGFGMGQIAWSPDGTAIAFSNFDAVATLAPFVTSSDPLPLHVVNVDGSDLRAVGPPFETCPSVGQKHCGADTFPAWSPDGSTIAFIRMLVGPSTTTAMTVSADGSDGRVLTECPKGLPCQSGIAWSPDGTSVAVPLLPETTAGTGSMIRIVRVGDGSVLDIPECAGCQGSSVAWSPDGMSLAYVSSGNGDQLALYVDTVDGHRPEQAVLLHLSVGAPTSVAWLPAGAITTPSASSSRSG